MKISDPKDKGTLYPIKDLARDVWQNIGNKKKNLIYGTVLRIISDIIQLYPAYALALIITKLTNNTATIQNILLIVSLCLIAYIARFITIFWAKKHVYNIAHLVWFQIEKKMLSILISKDSSWHEKESSGIKIKRIERGSMGYREILYAYINTYIETFISIIGMPIILFKFKPIIGISTVIFVIIYFVISKYLQKICLKRAHEFNVQEDLLSGQVFETVNHIRTIRVLNIGEKIIERVGIYINSLLFAVKNRIQAFQFRNQFMSIYSQVFKMVVVFFISISILHGKYEIGFIVLFIGYFEKIWEMIREVTDVSQDVLVARQSIARMYELVGKNIVKDKGTQEFPKTWSDLSIDNLTFYYGENVALKNVSFNVKRGEKIGIVGLSGAGKSTLFKLLIKERDDYEGNIKIDNVNIIDIKREDFYKKVSIVLQDTEVFNFSLKENIIISDISKKPDEKIIEKAIVVSHVKDFIHKLQNGINTVIGEKGIKLSGGERQRLGIARAIYKEPEILLLDEATSHLDLESEEKIQDSLKKFFKGVTAIVIAHRLTTIKEMDKIIVFEDGKIKEQGSFDELMSKKGRFNELWNKQLI
ncbi:MAG: ABC transporter ATP-binding protein [Candidatus Pacebacteria bacterium]|nr:ABC transporter ATP-binding protein [Candidatus Paceibacterota bacterium]